MKFLLFALVLIWAFKAVRCYALAPTVTVLEVRIAPGLLHFSTSDMKVINQLVVNKFARAGVKVKFETWLISCMPFDNEFIDLPIIERAPYLYNNYSILPANVRFYIVPRNMMEAFGGAAEIGGYGTFKAVAWTSERHSYDGHHQALVNTALGICHELGHVLGASHDASGQYTVMSVDQYSDVPMRMLKWSEKSKKAMRQTLAKYKKGAQ